jgi:hypothetical protein
VTGGWRSLRTWKPWAGLGIAAIAVLGAVVSAIFLSRLALRTGVPTDLAWTLPVVVDLGGGVATLLWIKGEKAVQGWARGVALGALVATLAGNSLSHLIEVGLVPVTVWLVIGVGAVYPAILWVMIHLLALSGSTPHTRSRTGRQTTDTVVRRTRPATGVAANMTTGPAANKSPVGQQRSATAPTGTPVVTAGPPHPAIDPGILRPVLHAVRADDSPAQPQPGRIDSDEVGVDVSDLVEDALQVAHELGGRLSRDALVDGLRSRGKSVGGRRRAAIYMTVRDLLATGETTEPGRPAATGR